MEKRKVIPECVIEGEILDSARLAKKAEDSKYTQKYVAGLVNLDQGIWSQWHKGTTRILDEYWLTFSIELGFDAFKTRPELLEKRRLLNKIQGPGDANAQPTTTRGTGAVNDNAGTYATDLAGLSESQKLKVIGSMRTELSKKGKLKLAQLLLADLADET